MLDFATTDLAFAIGHHLLIFALAGVLAFEIGVIRPGLTSVDVRRLSRVDIWYGILAGLILIVGFSRAVFAAKGWAYYSHNTFFWLKIGTFAIVGLLSIIPTIAIIRWRGLLKNDANYAPDQPEIRKLRRVLWLEALLFALIPAFAAAMARGYGS